MKISQSINKYQLISISIGLCLLVCLTLMFSVGCSDSSTNSSSTITEYPVIADTLAAINQGLAEIEVLMPYLSAIKNDTTLAQADDSVTLIATVDSSFQINNKNTTSINLKFENNPAIFRFGADCLEDSDSTIEIDVTIKGWKYQTEDGYFFFYEFLPHGLVFEEPLQLNQPNSNLNAGDIAVLFYGQQDGSSWQKEETKNVESNKISKFEIEHFSLYGVSSLRMRR